MNDKKCNLFFYMLSGGQPLLLFQKLPEDTIVHCIILVKYAICIALEAGSIMIAKIRKAGELSQLSGLCSRWVSLIAIVSNQSYRLKGMASISLGYKKGIREKQRLPGFPV
jgi:hypothetical protein